jgi:hypothetical protein
MVYTQLDGIRKAIVVGDDPSWESHYNYVDRKVLQVEQNLNTNLDNYATKTHVSQLVSGLDFSVDMSNYFTRAEVDNKLTTISGNFDNISNNLTGNYYTKTQSDARYPLMTDVFTKQQSDGKYALKSDSYTKSISDSRYLAPSSLNNYATTGSINSLESRLITRIDNASYTSVESNNRYPLKSELSTINQTISDLQEEIAKLGSSSQSYYVGDVYVTTINHSSPTAVNAHLGYGTWARYAEGRSIVGISTKPEHLSSYKTMGNEFGEDVHTLTTPEMPSHIHGALIRGSGGGSNTNGYSPSRGAASANYHQGVYNTGVDIEPTGSDQPHNNTQPSKVTGAWVRTA